MQPINRLTPVGRTPGRGHLRTPTPVVIFTSDRLPGVRPTGVNRLIGCMQLACRNRYETGTPCAQTHTGGRRHHTTQRRVPPAAAADAGCIAQRICGAWRCGCDYATTGAEFIARHVRAQYNRAPTTTLNTCHSLTLHSRINGSLTSRPAYM